MVDISLQVDGGRLQVGVAELLLQVILWNAAIQIGDGLQVAQRVWAGDVHRPIIFRRRIQSLDTSRTGCLVGHHPNPPLRDVLRRITTWE